jgi:hypothetical protein
MTGQDVVPTTEGQPNTCPLHQVVLKLQRIDKMVEALRPPHAPTTEILDRIELDMQSTLRLLHLLMNGTARDDHCYDTSLPRRTQTDTFRWMQTSNFMLIGPNWEIRELSAEVPMIVKKFPWVNNGPPGTITAFGPELNRVI